MNGPARFKYEGVMRLDKVCKPSKNGCIERPQNKETEMNDVIERETITVRWYPGEDISPIPEHLQEMNKPGWIVEMDEINHDPCFVETSDEARSIARRWKQTILSGAGTNGLSPYINVEIVEETSE
jgi:hypothetical protein